MSIVMIVPFPTLRQELLTSDNNSSCLIIIIGIQQGVF